MKNIEEEADQMIAQDVIAPAKNLEAIIEAWFAKHFRNAPISQNEQNYNCIHAAKEDLKTILAKL